MKIKSCLINYLVSINRKPKNKGPNYIIQNLKFGDSIYFRSTRMTNIYIGEHN